MSAIVWVEVVIILFALGFLIIPLQHASTDGVLNWSLDYTTNGNTTSTLTFLYDVWIYIAIVPVFLIAFYAINESQRRRMYEG